MSRTKSIKFKKNAGLYEMTCFVRKNNKRTNDAFTKWYSLISRYSSRDQLSLMPCLLEYGVKVKILPGTAQKYYGNNDVIPQVRDSLRIAGVVWWALHTESRIEFFCKCFHGKFHSFCCKKEKRLLVWWRFEFLKASFRILLPYILGVV